MKAILGLYLRAFTGLTRETWILSAAVFVNRAGSMVLFFLVLYLTRERGFSVQEAGGLLSLCGLGGILGAYLGGRLCDRVGTKAVQIGTLLAEGVGLFVVGALRSPVKIAVVMVAVTVIADAFRPANATAVAASCEPSVRSRGAALRRLAVNLGMTFGPALGGLLATYSYGWLFLVDGLTCIASALLLLFLAPHQPVEGGESGGTARRGGSVWRDVPFLAFLVLTALASAVYLQTLSTLPLTLRDLYRFSEAEIGLVLGLNPLLIVFVEMVLVYSLAHRNPLQVIAAGVFLTGVGFGLLPLGAGFLFVALALCVWTLGEMLTFPQAESFVANRAGGHNRGAYMGLYVQSFAVAAVLAPLAGTWVYERFGASAVWFGVAAVSPWLAAGYYALAVRTR